MNLLSMFTGGVEINNSMDNDVETVFVDTDEKMTIVMMKSDAIKEYEFENWSKNRPPDNVRVEQICEFYRNNQVKLVPGIIYTWKSKNKYIVYDGIHRMLAAILYGNPSVKLLISIRETSKEQDIIDDFTNINKSVSVPSVYMEENNVLKKMVCESVAKQLCNKYPGFVSPSRNPYQYNFNRDNLIEFLSTFEIDFCRSGIDVQILNELNGLNDIAFDYVVRNKINHPKKCDYHKFYLWFLDKSYIKKKIEQVLNE